MGMLDRMARVLAVIALPLALLLAPMYACITPGFIRHEYGQAGFPPATRFDDAERLAISDAIIAYLRGRLGREELAAVRTAGGEIALNEREVSHLVDVRAVMDALFRVQGIAALAALVPLAYLMARRRWRSIGRALRGGVAVTAVLIAAIIAAALVDFDVFFTAFHNVFFRSGTWTFEWTDTLIQLYPLPFWQDAVWKYGLLVLGEAALAVALSVPAVRRGDGGAGA